MCVAVVDCGLVVGVRMRCVVGVGVRHCVLIFFARPDISLESNSVGRVETGRRKKLLSLLTLVEC